MFRLTNGPLAPGNRVFHVERRSFGVVVKRTWRLWEVLFDGKKAPDLVVPIYLMKVEQ